MARQFAARLGRGGIQGSLESEELDDSSGNVDLQWGWCFGVLTIFTVI